MPSFHDRNLRRTYIGVGANLGNPIATVRKAIARLDELGTVTKRSSIYRTKPWGVENQPDYVNAVALLETLLEPHELLAGLQAIEKKLGRTPAERWAPRIVDLDILTYDAPYETLEGPDLQIPHPRMYERAFVLVPLAEIDPAFTALREALSQEERDTVTWLEST